MYYCTHKHERSLPLFIFVASLFENEMANIG